MKNLSTWMLVMFMALFWILRIAIVITYQMGIDFAGLKPFNETLEIVLLFVVLLCMVLIVKRKLAGALIYLAVYGIYFGTDLTTGINTLLSAEEGVTASSMGLYLGTFVSLIGIIIPLAVLLDLLLDKGRKANPKDKKTDWFYQNEQFDRQMDDRADKNNYKLL